LTHQSATFQQNLIPALFHLLGKKIMLHLGDIDGQAKACRNLSDACKAVGDVANAIEHMRQAHTCYAQVFGADHGYARWALGQVEALLAQQA
jgi:hypothetical protein